MRRPRTLAALLALAAAGPAAAQQIPPPQFRIDVPQFQQIKLPDFTKVKFEPQELDSALLKQMNQTMQDGVKNSHPMMRLVYSENFGLIVGGLAALLGLGFVGWLALKATVRGQATTDLNKLAATDPWIQNELRMQQFNQG